MLVAIRHLENGTPLRPVQEVKLGINAPAAPLQQHCSNEGMSNPVNSPPLYPSDLVADHQMVFKLLTRSNVI